MKILLLLAVLLAACADSPSPYLTPPDMRDQAIYVSSCGDFLAPDDATADRFYRAVGSTGAHDNTPWEFLDKPRQKVWLGATEQFLFDQALGCIAPSSP